MSITAAVLACVAQLVPLPTAALAAISPARLSLEQALRLGPAPSWLTVSISPQATVYAIGVLLGVVLMYGAARRLFDTGGVRQVCRGIAWLGLALACFAIAQRGAFHGRIYGFWTPTDTGAMPYGPFINRNHCATWLVMSIPLCFGYLMARLGADHESSGLRLSSLRHTIDGRTVWLVIAGTTMVLALTLSLSRSGISAFVFGALAMIVAVRSRLDAAKMAWVVGVGIAACVAIIAFADIAAVIGRFAEGLRAGDTGRVAIWRDTVTLARDFWLTGSGAGTYQTAMLIYQSGDRTYYFNHAHNHFLQVCAEGGLLVAVAAAIALAALATTGWRRLRSDGSGMFWIRAGAAAGLLGAAAQSMWEVGLALPANALLAAVLAAILTHEPRSASQSLIPHRRS